MSINARFTTDGVSLPVTLTRVATRPGHLRLKADAVVRPAELLKLAEWLTANAEVALTEEAILAKVEDADTPKTKRTSTPT